MLTLKVDMVTPSPPFLSSYTVKGLKITCGHLGRRVQAPATLTKDVGLFGHWAGGGVRWGGAIHTHINRPRQRFAQAIWEGFQGPGHLACGLEEGLDSMSPWSCRLLGLQLLESLRPSALHATPSSFHLQKQAMAQEEIVLAAGDNTQRCFKMNMA